MIFLLLFLFEIIFLFVCSRLLTNSLAHLLMRLTRSKTLTINIISFLFLPGVVVHEFSHFLSATFLFVKTGEIEFIPQITDGGVKLGSVGIAGTDPIRRAIIGFAPVIIGIGIITTVLFYFFNGKFGEIGFNLKTLLVLYVVFEIGNTMFSSRKDLEGTLELLAVLAVFLIAFYLIGFRIPAGFTRMIFSYRNIELVKQGNLLLLAPILIDLLVIGGMRLLKI